MLTMFMWILKQITLFIDTTLTCSHYNSDQNRYSLDCEEDLARKGLCVSVSVRLSGQKKHQAKKCFLRYCDRGMVHG